MSAKTRGIFTVLLLLFFMASCTTISPSPNKQAVGMTAVPIATAALPSPSATIIVLPTLTRAPTPDVPENATEATPTRKIIKSIDVMKYSQDAACDPLNEERIAQMIRLIKEAGANYVAISSPLNNVQCKDGHTGDSIILTHAWVKAARDAGLSVWFRQKSSSYNGFYDTPRNFDLEHQIQAHVDYITTYPNLFAPGDIYTPNTEPGSNQIQGVNCFPDKGDQCLFTGKTTADAVMKFNDWRVKAYNEVKTAFQKIGLDDSVFVGYWGDDGFVAWGDRNSSWHGVISPGTFNATGNQLTFDHYFKEVDATLIDASSTVSYHSLLNTFSDDGYVARGILSEIKTGKPDPFVEFAKIRALFPQSDLCIGEWGAINGESPEYTMEVFKAAYHFGIRCFNYWQLGPGGNEALLDNQNGSLVPNPLYEAVKKFYIGH